jgi:hypothetical protein
VGGGRCRKTTGGGEHGVAGITAAVPVGALTTDAVAQEARKAAGIRGSAQSLSPAAAPSPRPRATVTA